MEFAAVCYYSVCVWRYFEVFECGVFFSQVREQFLLQKMLVRHLLQCKQQQQKGKKTKMLT